MIKSSLSRDKEFMGNNTSLLFVSYIVRCFLNSGNKIALNLVFFLQSFHHSHAPSHDECLQKVSKENYALMSNPGLCT